MKRYTQLFALLCLFLFACTAQQKQEKPSFVEVKEGAFVRNGESYTYVGANYWQGMNLGAPKGGDRARLCRELDELQAMGVTNLRVLAGSEADEEMRFAIQPGLQTAPGVYNEDLFQGLDFFLAEMEKRDMTAVMVLSNFWTWSGGFPQYLKWSGAGIIPYPQEEGTSWQQFTDYSKQFYFNPKAQQMYKNHVATVINRINTLTGRSYKDDSTIMSWQLANEPRGYDVPEAFRKWAHETANYIKSIDSKHLVCLGTEGNTSGTQAGVNVELDNDCKAIDYITMHIWAQNWGWFKPGDSEQVYQTTLSKVEKYWADHVKVAEKLNKPIVLEEFGIARDQCSFEPTASVTSRNQFFETVLSKWKTSVESNQKVKGINFWSYSGEGRPTHAGQFWQKGDCFLGDPPHELQGWYGVYNSDQSTVDLIKRFAIKR